MRTSERGAVIQHTHAPSFLPAHKLPDRLRQRSLRDGRPVGFARVSIDDVASAHTPHKILHGQHPKALVGTVVLFLSAGREIFAKPSRMGRPQIVQDPDVDQVSVSGYGFSIDIDRRLGIGVDQHPFGRNGCST